jgi:hypothetical protein
MHRHLACASNDRRLVRFRADAEGSHCYLHVSCKVRQACNDSLLLFNQQVICRNELKIKGLCECALGMCRLAVRNSRSSVRIRRVAPKHPRNIRLFRFISVAIPSHCHRLSEICPSVSSFAAISRALILG